MSNGFVMNNFWVEIGVYSILLPRATQALPKSLEQFLSLFVFCLLVHFLTVYTDQSYLVWIRGLRSGFSNTNWYNTVLHNSSFSIWKFSWKLAGPRIINKPGSGTKMAPWSFNIAPMSRISWLLGYLFLSGTSVQWRSNCLLIMLVWAYISNRFAEMWKGDFSTPRFMDKGYTLYKGSTIVPFDSPPMSSC